MILSLESWLRTVFLLYAVFWVAVVVGTYFGVGLLMRRADRSAGKHGHDASH